MLVFGLLGSMLLGMGVIKINFDGALSGDKEKQGSDCGSLFLWGLLKLVRSQLGWVSPLRWLKFRLY